MTIVALVFTLYLLLDEFDRDTRLLLTSLAILYWPLAYHFLDAQVQIFILLLLTLSMRCLTRQYDVLAGSILAIAGLLRVFPLIFLGYLLIRRRWTSLLAMLFTLVTGAAITLRLLGVTRALAFLRVMGPLSEQLKAPVAISLPALISRGFWLFDDTNWPLELARHITIGIACSRLLILAVRATTKNSTCALQTDKAFGLWAVTILLLTPTTRPYCMVLLFLPFAQLVSAAKTERCRRSGYASAVIL